MKFAKKDSKKEDIFWMKLVPNYYYWAVNIGKITFKGLDEMDLRY